MPAAPASVEKRVPATTRTAASMIDDADGGAQVGLDQDERDRRRRTTTPIGRTSSPSDCGAGERAR